MAYSPVAYSSSVKFRSAVAVVAVEALEEVAIAAIGGHLHDTSTEPRRKNQSHLFGHRVNRAGTSPHLTLRYFLLNSTPLGLPEEMPSKINNTFNLFIRGLLLHDQIPNCMQYV